MTGRSRDVTRELTEIRTVLSRAETAAAAIRHSKAEEGCPMTRWIVTDGKGDWEHYSYQPDPEADEMLAALGQVVQLLGRWRGTRRSRASRWRQAG